MRIAIPIFVTSVFFFIIPRFFWFFIPAPATGLIPVLFTLMAFTAVGLLVFVQWRSNDPAMSRWDRIVEKSAHLSIGYLSFLLVLLILRDVTLLFVPAETAEWLRSPAGNFGLFLLILGCVMAGFLNAVRGPEITRVTVRPQHLHPDDSLPPEFHLRIVQISDLHVGSWIGRKYVDLVMEKILALGEIDLLLLTGDIGDGDPVLHRGEIEPLGKIRARLGKYSVSGNHEGYWNEAAWNEVIRSLGFRILENESETVRGAVIPIRIAGIADFKPDISAALAALTPEGLNLFLAHQPKHADRAAEFTSRLGGRLHLQFSGHTHNGQFLPWNLLIGFFQKYPRGLYQVGKMNLYVNIGTGFWGAPLRLGTRSEITFLEIRG